ncbi:Uncharacterized protein PBTT_07157 [Plasmodiophora brassicae]|uniref:Uncharacterized protein n=1 Tax=Plasmodiophora brassicae TaxID=37360 RepID=A0A0G4J7T1_PLABS|nr:hypothetical protein PBRA_003254 [Plasmodiophora brassicae]SPQ99617.1 unnamed protein product [Plasmodiophora brassicae]
MGTKSRAPATLLTATARQTREVACAFSPFSGAIRILAVSLVMNSRDAEYGLPCSRAEHDISNNDALRAALHSYRRVVLHSDRVNCRMDAVLPVITADPEVAPRACRTQVEIAEQVTATIRSVSNALDQWEVDAANRLVDEIATLAAPDAVCSAATSPCPVREPDRARLAGIVEGDLLLHHHNGMEAVIGEMSQLLDDLVAEDDRQASWLNGIDLLLSVYDEAHRGSLSRSSRDAPGDPNEDAVWRSMYMELKQRFQEELRRQLAETEVSLTISANTSIDWGVESRCETAPDATIGSTCPTICAQGLLHELTDAISNVRLRAQRPGPIHVAIAIDLVHPTCPPIHNSSTVDRRFSVQLKS